MQCTKPQEYLLQIWVSRRQSASTSLSCYHELEMIFARIRDCILLCISLWRNLFISLLPSIRESCFLYVRYITIVKEFFKPIGELQLYPKFSRSSVENSIDRLAIFSRLAVDCLSDLLYGKTRHRNTEEWVMGFPFIYFSTLLILCYCSARLREIWCHMRAEIFVV